MSGFVFNIIKILKIKRNAYNLLSTNKYICTFSSASYDFDYKCLQLVAWNIFFNLHRHIVYAGVYTAIVQTTIVDIYICVSVPLTLTGYMHIFFIYITQ